MTRLASGPIVAWGEVLWDRFPTGHMLGGAPANVAYHLAALGSDVVLVTRVGDDQPGRLATARLGEAGVRTDHIQIDDERETGEVGVEIAASGDAIYTLFGDRAWERIACGPSEVTTLETASAIVYGTLAQRRPDGREAHRAAIAATREQTLRVCDPNLRGGSRGLDMTWPLLREALSAATVVKINTAEATFVARHTGGKDAVDWLLQDAGVELVALTRGADGCSLRTLEGSVDAPGVPAPAGGDNVGCGDAFVAVLTRGALAGWPLERIAGAACRYASFVAGHRGATPPVDEALVRQTLEPRSNA